MSLSTVITIALAAVLAATIASNFEMSPTCRSHTTITKIFPNGSTARTSNAADQAQAAQDTKQAEQLQATRSQLEVTKDYFNAASAGLDTILNK